MIISTLIAAAALGHHEPPVPGNLAPSFTAEDMSGNKVSLDQYDGKWVVLEWTNKGCPFVKKHYASGSMQATQKWATDKGVVWLTVISSAPGNQGYMSASEAKDYYKGSNWAGTDVLLDPTGALGHEYDAKTTPDMLVLNPQHTIVYEGAIDNQRTPDPSSLNGATNYVKQALDEAMAGKTVTTPLTKSYGCSVKYAQ